VFAKDTTYTCYREKPVGSNYGKNAAHYVEVTYSSGWNFLDITHFGGTIKVKEFLKYDDDGDDHVNEFEFSDREVDLAKYTSHGKDRWVKAKNNKGEIGMLDLKDKDFTLVTVGRTRTFRDCSKLK
tara:strand:+ start:165 stop:542 length:378 start_codon:yes stop_codon:yes gene_type:complete